MRRSARVRPGRLATAALAVVLVTGCAQNAPGVAAQVGNDRITDEQVDRLAETLCALNAEAPEPIATQQVRGEALRILLNEELADDVIDRDLLDEEQLAAAREQAAATREALPERLRGSFDDAFDAVTSFEPGLVALGRQSLAGKGTADADVQAALAEGQRLFRRHVRSTEVSVDPRFGTFERGQLQPSDGSLSVPVSEQARSSTTEAGAATDLPENLVCARG